MERRQSRLEGKTKTMKDCQSFSHLRTIKGTHTNTTNYHNLPRSILIITPKPAKPAYKMTLASLFNLKVPAGGGLHATARRFSAEPSPTASGTGLLASRKVSRKEHAQSQTSPTGNSSWP
ncbi:hypothetical protein ACOSQ2_032357 [Xanthoceras sorbifolium]